MKNKKLLKAIAALTMSVAAASTMSLFGCKHSHDFSGDWKTDAEYHWKECEKDGEKDQLEKHVFTDDTDPTCNTCGYERTITPPSHTHEYGDWKSDDDKHWKECTANDGSKSDEGAHTWIDSTTETGKEVCSVCGKVRDKVNDNPNPSDPVALEDIKVDVDMLAEAAFSVDAPTNWDADGVIKLYSGAGVDADGNPKNTVWSYEAASGTAVKDAAGETYKTTVGRLKPNGSAPYIIIDLKGYTGNGKITLSCVPAGGSERSITFAENADGAEAIFTQSYTDSKTKLYITQDVVGGKEYKISFSNGFNFYGIVIEKEAGSTNPPDTPDTSLEDAKTAAKAELDGYKSSIIAALEDETVKTNIASKKSEGSTAIDAATSTDAVTEALNAAKAEVDTLIASVKTLAQLQADAVTTLSSYADTKKADYDATDDAALIEAIEAVVSKYATETTGLFFAETVTKENLPALEAAAKKEIDDLIAADTLSKTVFTVKFMDGTTELSSQSIKYNEQVTKPNDPVKDGFKFLGWYNGENLFNFETPITANLNLTAKWRELSDYDKYLAQFGDKVIYNNDFDTPVDRLDSFSGTYGTKGVYFEFNSVNSEVAGDKYYVTVADGYAKMVDGGASGTRIVFDFGKTYVKSIEGYTEIKTNSSSNSWTFMQFVGNSANKSGSEVLGLRTNGGNIQYRLDGGTVATPSATIATADTTYKIYFKFDFTTGKVEMTINGQKFFGEDGLQTGITSIQGIKFVSSDSNQRTVDVDNFVVAGELKTLDEYKTEVVASLDKAYQSYDLNGYPNGGRELTGIYDAAKSAIVRAESYAQADELLAKAIADMKAVLSNEGLVLQEAKTNAIDELNATDKTNYTINAEALESAIADGIKAINAASTAEKVTEALNTAKAAIAEIDNDATALPKLKAAAVEALEAHDGGAANFTVEGEGGNKTAYEDALASGTKAINDIAVSDSLSYVEAVTAINTALESAKAAIDELDNDVEMLEKAKAAAIAEIDDLVADKIAEIDAKVESGDITDTDKVASVKAEIGNIRDTRVRAIESADTLAQVATEKTQAINNIETEAATLTATPEQLRALAEKAIKEHAAPFIENYPDYATAITSIRDDALTLLATKTDKEEISLLQTTTTRKISVYVEVHEAYKAIDAYAAELKDTIYNNSAKAAIDAEIKRGSELNSNEWSADMWTLHLTEEVANVAVNKKVVIDALDKIVADLKATTFTVTIVGVDNVTATAKYGQKVVIDSSKLPDNVMIKALYTDESMSEDKVYDLEAPVYDDLTLYAKMAEATALSENNKFVWADIDPDGLTAPDATNPTNKDQAVLTNDHLTGANAFLEVTGMSGAVAKYRTETDKSVSGVTGGIIQISGEALKVKFNGTGTLTIAVRSGGNTAVSKFAVKNADGEYIAANKASVTGDIKQPDTNSNMYTVTGKVYLTVVFTIDKAGDYTICQFDGEGLNTALRLAKIEKADSWKVENDVLVTWGDGEQKSYYHEQEIVVPEYTGTDGALEYWYVEGNEGGDHYLAGQKVKLPAGTYKMVAKTVSANVTITYIVDDEEKVVSYYVANGTTGVTNTVADPVKDGYVFKGWYTTATPDDTAEPFNFGAVAPDDTVTVYAVFENKPAPSVWLFTNGESTSTNGAAISNFDGAIEISAAGSKFNNKDVTSKGVIINETSITKAIVTSGSGKTINIKANKDMQVTVYACMTSSGGTDIAAGTLTIANATTGNGGTDVTSSDKYVALTFTLTAGTTCNLTQSASKYIAIYEIDVEFI